jgi:hypothetical protein
MVMPHPRIRARRGRWLRAATALAAAALAAGATLGARPAAAASAGPDCVPAALDASAQLDGAVTVSPMPGAADASPATQISFLGVPLGALTHVAVVGSLSGSHPGRLEAYSQDDGGSFLPTRPFTPGEQVAVSAQLTLAGTTQPLAFSFTVAHLDALSQTPETPRPTAADSVSHYISQPGLEPPLVSVHTLSPARSSGDALLAPYGTLSQAGPMILDSSGGLVWFNPLRAPLVATNLRVQRLDGAPVLTWWQGVVTTHGFGLGVDVVDNTRYRTIAEVRAGNGYEADLHEFQITPAGTALISSYHAVDCDLAGVGGRAFSAVTDSLLQEIDIRTGLVMFEWTSLDHVPLSASYASPAGSSTIWPFDFFHLNSINLDADGTLLVSGRNTWAAYDVDASTGQLVWELGGKQSSFSEGRGAATAYQHDARPDGASAFSMFDNGGFPQVHAQSRGVVLSVDPQTRTVSVLAQFLHPGRPLLSESQGDLQALPGGDWFVGWGQEPDFSEFSPAGKLLFDASLPTGYESYRALSYSWDATPLGGPAAALRRDARGRPEAYVSWNGATQVVRWELLEGSSPEHLVRVAVVPRSGFETVVPMTSSSGYAAVVALDSAGRPIGHTATLDVAVALGG